MKTEQNRAKTGLTRWVVPILGLFFIPSVFPQSPDLQEMKGHVHAFDSDGFKVPLIGASVFYSDGSAGTSTDAEGGFSIRKITGPRRWLAVRHLGYEPDSIAMAAIRGNYIEFILRPTAQESERITVTGTRRGSSFSQLTDRKSEVITRAGLMKMACCNLAESFENSATVTTGYTDAVSGARQVQLLGLAGIYCQMMAENIPVMRGLASTYGWSYTPGPWLESIQISKGASSVVNGYESISGQMNLEFKKPENTEDLFVNLYGDAAGRMEANVTAALQLSGKLWSGLLLHGSMENREHDRNGDGFMDMPQTKFINLYNRWAYFNPERGIESRTGFKYLSDTRNGGQMSTLSLPRRYAVNIDNQNFAVENKTGFSVGRKTEQSLGMITRFSHDGQNSHLGLKSFDGIQNSLYANVLFTSRLGTTGKHRYTVGGSFMYDHYHTSYQDKLPSNHTPLTRIDREEAVPGLFGEYTFSFHEKFTLLAGVRSDYNTAFGWLFTPRLNLRYNLTGEILLRASAGRGFRSPNVMAENIGLLGSSRRIHVTGVDSLDIEKAWNVGGNLSFHIPVWNGETLTLSLDWFRTHFENQAVIDMERNRRSLYFYNLDGRSYSDVWQADLSLTPFRGFDILAAFRYNNTQVTLSNGAAKVTLEKALISRYRGLVNLSFATPFRKWMFDATVQINGPSRLPNLNGYDEKSNYSPVFPIWFAQITKRTKRLDLYAGVENIFDYVIKNPVLQAGEPFGDFFDSSQIWGPLIGRRIYGGIRLKIGKF